MIADRVVAMRKGGVNYPLSGRKDQLQHSLHLPALFHEFLLQRFLPPIILFTHNPAAAILADAILIARSVLY